MLPNVATVLAALRHFEVIERVATAFGQVKNAVTAHKHANACREILGEPRKDASDIFAGFDSMFADVLGGTRKPS